VMKKIMEELSKLIFLWRVIGFSNSEGFSLYLVTRTSAPIASNGECRPQGIYHDGELKTRGSDEKFCLPDWVLASNLVFVDGCIVWDNYSGYAGSHLPTR
jgi:hypothetical protein